jgi:hypothetical protein
MRRLSKYKRGQVVSFCINGLLPRETKTGRIISIYRARASYYDSTGFIIRVSQEDDRDYRVSSFNILGLNTLETLKSLKQGDNYGK